MHYIRSCWLINASFQGLPRFCRTVAVDLAVEGTVRGFCKTRDSSCCAPEPKTSTSTKIHNKKWNYTEAVGVKPGPVNPEHVYDFTFQLLVTPPGSSVCNECAFKNYALRFAVLWFYALYGVTARTDVSLGLLWGLWKYMWQKLEGTATQERTGGCSNSYMHTSREG